MLPGLRQLRIALKTFALQRAGGLPSNPTQIHPQQIRNFAFTPRVLVDEPNVKDTALFQQLATNPTAINALKNFGQQMKDQGIDFSPDSPPSTMQLFKLLANSEFRKAVAQLKDDLEKAGVDVSSDNAMALLEGYRKQSESKPK